MIKFIARKIIISLIWLYRRFGRRLVKRRCIYEQSCSTFALIALRSNGDLIADLKKIYKRVSGCGISIIYQRDHRQCVILNLHGSAISNEELRSEIVERYNLLKL
jgi:putative component of membrane protein insertase Oxa1/YidC/SpoIIIJ protein YidD